MNFFRHAGGFNTQPLTGPISHFDGVLLNWSNGMIRVDVARRALQEKADHAAAKRILDSAIHRCWEIR